MTKPYGLAPLVAVAIFVTNPVWACVGERTPKVWVIDQFLARANLSEPDLQKVRSLRQAIVDLLARGETAAALAAEAEAMTLMGYKFEALRGGCGHWVPKQKST